MVVGLGKGLVNCPVILVIPFTIFLYFYFEKTSQNISATLVSIFTELVFQGFCIPLPTPMTHFSGSINGNPGHPIS